MSRFSINADIYRLLAALLRRMEAKQHATGVLDTPAAYESGHPARLLVYVTFDEATAERAREALEKAGCLPGEEVQG